MRPVLLPLIAALGLVTPAGWLAAQPASPELTADSATAPASAEAVPETPPDADRPLVYRFMLHDSMIDPSTVFYFTRAYTRAEEAGADAVIIDIDTPGGRVDSCLLIRNRIFDSEIPTYAFVRSAISAGALIALATDSVFIARAGTIGGAQPIMAGGEGMDETVNEKITSILRAEVRALMEAQRDRNPDRWTDEEFVYQVQLAEAFITPPEEDIVSLYSSPEVVCREGELLTMTYRQAVAEHLAQDQADSVDDVLRLLEMGNAEIREVQLTWSEKLARFLSMTMVSSFLLLVGLGGLYLEFKAPGFGAPGAIGLAALALFFFGAYVADLSTIIEPILVIVGLVLLGVELFVLPGFGIAGIAGIMCIFLGLIMALVKMPPPEFEFSMIYVNSALNAVAVGLVLLVIGAIVLARWLPKSVMWERLALEPATIGGVSSAIPAGALITDIRKLIGKTGLATTDLRPAGTVTIDGDPYDVVTQGEYILQGNEVVVLQTVGTRIVVAKRDQA